MTLLLRRRSAFSRYGRLKLANVLLVGYSTFDPAVLARYWSLPTDFCVPSLRIG